MTETVLAKFNRQLDDETNNVRMLHRTKKEIMEDRKRKKHVKPKTGWFQAKGYRAILRVENTPEGKLAKKIKERILKDDDLNTMGILV